MRQMAKDELPALRGKAAELEEKLKILLLPKDPNDERDVILEVRAGAGGDEAGLFASEVLRMYMRYAERKGWRATVVDSSENAAGGIKDATVTISNPGSTDVTIDKVEITGANASAFSITSTTCGNGSAVSPNQSCQVVVHYTPPALGSASAALVVTSTSTPRTSRWT